MRTTTPARRSLLLLLLAALCLALSACAVPTHITLVPGRTAPPPATPEARATVLLHPFAEGFTPDASIGSHQHAGNRQTSLQVRRGAVGQALDGLLHRELAARNIVAASDGSRWDLSPEGLAAFAAPARLLLTGRITALRINADETVTTGKARAEMDVECVLGLVQEQKVIRRSVHVAQEMVTFSINRQKLEKLLNDCLITASKEILAQYGELVAAPAMPPDPSRNLTANEAERSAKR